MTYNCLSLVASLPLCLLPFLSPVKQAVLPIFPFFLSASPCTAILQQVVLSKIIDP
jgi:hypothetical protein